MKIEFHGPRYSADVTATVTLSRKNLLAGLHKLDMPGSARTIISGDDRLILKFETDAEHYADRPTGPAGAMHPDTEKFIAAVQEDANPFIIDTRPIIGHCSECGEAREDDYTCRKGGSTTQDV